jgi:hypothetical protein
MRVAGGDFCGRVSVVAAILAVAMGAGASVAQAADGLSMPESSIRAVHACITSGGLLRIAAQCAPGEPAVAVSMAPWTSAVSSAAPKGKQLPTKSSLKKTPLKSHRGPRGPRGPKGPAGPAGQTGSSGTTYTAGTGLSLSPTNVFSLNSPFLNNLPIKCASGAISQISASATPTCTPVGSGTITGVTATAGGGLTGGGTSGNVSLGLSLPIALTTVDPGGDAFSVTNNPGGTNTGDAIHGSSSGSYGVQGTGTSGALGGVEGDSSASPGVIGSSTSAAGVSASSTSGNGVDGTSSTGAGVVGTNTSSSPFTANGIDAGGSFTSTNGNALYANTQNSVGLYVQNNSSTGYDTIEVHAVNTASIPLYIYNANATPLLELEANGNLIIHGTITDANGTF